MRIRGSFALVAGALVALPLATRGNPTAATVQSTTTTAQSPDAVV